MGIMHREIIGLPCPYRKQNDLGTLTNPRFERIQKRRFLQVADQVDLAAGGAGFRKQDRRLRNCLQLRPRSGRGGECVHPG